MGHSDVLSEIHTDAKFNNFKVGVWIVSTGFPSMFRYPTIEVLRGFMSFSGVLGQMWT